MKTITLATVAVLVCTATIYAQKASYSIKPGENIDAALADSVKYHYPNFTQGTVFFRDGKAANASLNYNILLGEMQFVAPKGDTLAIADEANIKYVAIGKDTFFYDKVYLQLVAGNTVGKLAKKQVLALGNVKKVGAYGQLSSTSSITTVSSLNSNSRVTNLTENKELTLLGEATYYVGDTYNHFLQANKKNIMKLFGKKQSAIEQYLKDNKVNFSKEEDLKALITFLEGQ